MNCVKMKFKKKSVNKEQFYNKRNIQFSIKICDLCNYVKLDTIKYFQSYEIWSQKIFKIKSLINKQNQNI